VCVCVCVWSHFKENVRVLFAKCHPVVLPRTWMFKIQIKSIVINKRCKGRTNIKDKGISIQASTRPKGSSNLTFSQFPDNLLKKVARLSAVPTDRLYPRKYTWYSFLLVAEGLSQWKIPRTLSGIEFSNFWLVAQCLNQLLRSLHRLLMYNSVFFWMNCLDWESAWSCRTGFTVTRRETFIFPYFPKFRDQTER
jgi:hypothetical protein